ncbi:N-acetylmuramoyl-L-alanine amidase family protein [Deminuibacter soli]|uniref:N-acetylmuramoyl-L-alanine amidase n=1 Tax=Deminuibacter soli TaxID=2291815 RepID=A0A3E1NGM3_9BACT|nr:N-acetylmuramoyl-L-alanine amidase [Deminuibacter soli]RFM27099.1 N-acetylmuramoyl-L-alanine amidase [Deminuibacter soli]
MKKKFLGILLLWIVSSSFLEIRSFNQGAFQKNTLKTIVIDAGHGGRDEGAPGDYSYEKDIALAVALKLRDKITREFPEIRVIMTRTTDSYPTLHERADLANQSKADLFISIHCNSADPIRHSEQTGYRTETYYRGKGKKRKKYTHKVPTYRYWTTPNPAEGTETYIWAAHKSEAKEVAMRENESLFVDSSTASSMKDFDMDSPQKRILYALKTQQYFTRSANLALTVEDEFKKIGRISREARQRQVGIWVLQATAMPSILVETGYISNPREENYLNSEKGQNEITDVLVKALGRYKYSLENNTLIPPAAIEAANDSAAAETNTPAAAADADSTTQPRGQQ